MFINPQQQALEPWIAFFLHLLKLDIKPELSSFTDAQEVIEERDKAIQWKIKAIASKTTYRLLSKYGNPSYMKEELQGFHKYF